HQCECSDKSENYFESIRDPVGYLRILRRIPYPDGALVSRIKAISRSQSLSDLLDGLSMLSGIERLNNYAVDELIIPKLADRGIWYECAVLVWRVVCRHLH